jgi:hypothetical protein
VTILDACPKPLSTEALAGCWRAPPLRTVQSGNSLEVATNNRTFLKNGLLFTPSPPADLAILRDIEIVQMAPNCCPWQRLRPSPGVITYMTSIEENMSENIKHITDASFEPTC